MTRATSLWIFACALLGCNAILGIEEAKLDPDASVSPTGAAGNVGAAGSGGAAGTGGAGGAGGGMCAALTAPDACNKCVAQRCCDQFDACTNDADCKSALGDYNTCVGMAFTNDAGGTCDETFGASLNTIRGDLAACAFQASAPTGCLDVCFGKPVGSDICITYCNCVSATCPERDFDGGDCATLCAGFTEAQLTCRPYHCRLAQISKTNTFGVSLCP